MQNMLNVTEMISQGRSKGSKLQPSAGKQPVKTAVDGLAENSPDFSDIMAALMRLRDDHLNRSLDRSENARNEEKSLRSVLPLIDLIVEQSLPAANGDHPFSQISDGDLIEPLSNGLEPADQAMAAVLSRRSAGVDGIVSAERKEDGAPQNGKVVPEPPSAFETIDHRNEGGRPISAAETKVLPADDRGPAAQLQKELLRGKRGAYSTDAGEEKTGLGPRIGEAAPKKAFSGFHPKNDAGISQESEGRRQFSKDLESGVNHRPVSQPRGDVNDIAPGHKPGEALPEELSPAPLRSPPQVADVRWQQTGSAELEPAKSTSGESTPRTMETDLIRQIVQRMTLNTAGGRSYMQIKLKPEFLGNLRMHIMTEDHKVMIRITAETQQVKEIIERHIQVLKADLQQHGLQIQKVDVSIAPESETWRDDQQQMAFRQSQDQRRRQSRRPGEADIKSKQSDLLDVGTSSIQMTGKSGEVDYFV